VAVDDDGTKVVVWAFVPTCGMNNVTTSVELAGVGHAFLGIRQRQRPDMG